MKTFKQVVNEAIDKYKVYMVDNTFWVAYGDGSGTTSQIDNMNSFLTDKSKDSHYDNIVNQVVKFAKTAKAIKSKKTSDTEANLYEMPYYLHRDVRQGKMDVWGGTIKPNKMYYMLLTKQGDIHIVNFFTKKNEALAWIKSIA